MLNIGGGSLSCPHCGHIRFTKFAPPYCAMSEVQCARCHSRSQLAELKPLLAREQPVMVNSVGDPLGCPRCGDIRFTRFAPPYGAMSEVQCARCHSRSRLAELEPVLVPELPLQAQQLSPRP